MSKMEEQLRFLRWPKVDNDFYVCLVHLPLYPENAFYDTIEYQIDPNRKLVRLISYQLDAPNLTKKVDIFSYESADPDPVFPEVDKAYVDALIESKARKI